MDAFIYIIFMLCCVSVVGIRQYVPEWSVLLAITADLYSACRLLMMESFDEKNPHWRDPQ